LVPSTGDHGRLLYASALAIKVMEDKTYPGALIACLCVPWGESVSADFFATGYRAVWVRDFFQVGMAFLALGDRDTAKVAFKYLPRMQVTASTPGVGSANDHGWFLQKTRVNGELEWIKLQKDQTAMPLMYAWKLWKANVLTRSEIASAYDSMLKPAADFLSNNSSVDLTLGTYHYMDTYKLSETEQERWEEERGRSPSTIASVIAGLIAAADMADMIGGSETRAADDYRNQADAMVANLDQMFTKSGFFGDGQYFIRIGDNDDPNDVPVSDHQICINNGGPCVSERAILDGGFLELVRYGVLAANDQKIQHTLDEYNLQLPGDIEEHDRTRYDFDFGGTKFPAWRRYSQDHYGERKSDGQNFSGDNPDNRGRPWPLLTGEYGIYELERIRADGGGSVSDIEINGLRDTYVRAMEHFSNDSLMLPEQVWDGVSHTTVARFTVGKGTNSATPLAWPHAEYIKLVRSYRDRENFSKFSVVADRYVTRRP
jgi:glucoamylase